MSKIIAPSFNIKKGTYSRISNIEPDNHDKIEIVDFEDTSNLENTSSPPKTLSTILKPFNDFTTNLTATKTVANIKIAAGILDVFEHIGDGIQWTHGKIAEGRTFVIAQLAGIFSKDAKDYILKIRDYMKEINRKTIAVNEVDNIEKSLFDTKFFGDINEDSYMKHDSKIANGIEKASKVTAEIVGATAATIVTGGVASPTLVTVVGGLGFAEGTGEQAQKTYQENTKTTGTKEAGILLSGLEGATKWYAFGRLGMGAISITNQISEMAAHGQWTTRFGSSNTVRDALKTIFRTRRHRNAGTMLKNSAKVAATSFTDIVDMSNGVFGTLANSLNNGDMSAGATGGTIALGLATSFVTNTLINRADYFGGSLRSLDFVDSLDKRMISLVKTLIKTADAVEDSVL